MTDENTETVVPDAEEDKDTSEAEEEKTEESSE